MSARLLDGKRIADELLDRLAARVQARVRAGKPRPGLAVILVGNEAASAVYVRNKRRACERVGFLSLAFDLPEATPEAELAALNRDYEVTRKKYDELVSRRESVKLSQEAERSKQEIRFKILDPPRVPLKPTGPNRLLLMSAVLGAGLAAGMGLAFLIAQLWPTFDSRFSLKQIADIPVFGSVSAVLPATVLSRERRMAVVYAGLVGVLVLVYAGLLFVERLGFR